MFHMSTRSTSKSYDSIIASGGAGKPFDMIEVVKKGLASAVLAASIFHYGIHSIVEVKKEMRKANINVRITW